MSAEGRGVKRKGIGRRKKYENGKEKGRQVVIVKGREGERIRTKRRKRRMMMMVKKIGR